LFQLFKQQLKSLASLNTKEYEDQFIQSQRTVKGCLFSGLGLEEGLLYICAVCIVKFTIWSRT